MWRDSPRQQRQWPRRQGQGQRCKFFDQGCCKFGDNCKYAHVFDQGWRGPVHVERRQGQGQGQKCKFFDQGCCKFGDDCKYAHVFDQGWKRQGWRRPVHVERRPVCVWRGPVQRPVERRPFKGILKGCPRLPKQEDKLRPKVMSTLTLASDGVCLWSDVEPLEHGYMDEGEFEKLPLTVDSAFC